MPPTPTTTKLLTAAVAFGAVMSLIMFQVLGIFDMLPKAAAVALVLGELAVPFVVYRVSSKKHQSQD